MSLNKLVIKRINRFSEKTLKDLNVLALQISSRKYQMTASHLKSLLKNKNVYLIGIYDGNTIVGTATLVQVFQITGPKGYLEDLVVDEKYRGRGLGTELVMRMIRLAKKLKIYKLKLKSETHRIAGNKIYKKLGFTSEETNVYNMIL